MPPRPFLSATAEVVWGVTTQNNGTPYVLDYGDGSAQQTGTVADRSYIAFTHAYPLAGTYTVRLCVGAGAAIPGCPAEQAQTVVQVYNPAAISAIELRNVNIQRAIENGLRYLWTAQSNRAGNFPAGAMTDWGGLAGYTGSNASLVVLAFENHGYKLPNNNSEPTGIYEKYIVRRGLNFILNNLRTHTLGVQPAGDPCVGLSGKPDPCVGLILNQDGTPPPGFAHSGYETGLATLPFAGSGALNRVVSNEIPGTNNAGYVVGKTLGEILQRLTNSLSWGQLENATNGNGGWTYALNYTGLQASDGSTVGWIILALLDAKAAGAEVPAFVPQQWGAPNQGVNSHFNNDGSFDYQSNNNRTFNDSVNVAKTGVGIQGLFFAGRPNNDPDLTNALNWIDARWANQGLGQSFVCGNGTYNKGCGYGMYNVFKGLKLYGITQLPSVNRPAGPGPIPEDDWYADYVDYLLANQTNPTTTVGGNWGPLYFSSQTSNEPGEAALAELILSPVALVAPDPDRFGSVGLQHGTPLSVNPASNPTGTPHTVVAKAESGGANPSPIPGVTIAFQVTGRNAGVSGACAPVNCVSGADGIVTYTYTDAGPAATPGQDNIQAFIGSVGGSPASNLLVKNWTVAAALRCDANADGSVTMADLQIINASMGQPASGASDPRDGNGDGAINIADLRFCQRQLTPAN